jgi:cytochrome b6-f complex iron-sulfur subunit
MARDRKRRKSAAGKAKPQPSASTESSSQQNAVSDPVSSRSGRDRGDGPRVTRRDWLSRIWLFLGGIVVLEAGWVAAGFVGPRRRRAGGSEGDSIIVAGPAERFEPGTVTAFPQGKFYLARLKDGGFLALGRECTHLGCTVPWDAESDRFVCPCHASAFDITGAVLSPPAPRPLDLLAVRIENDIVKVDVGDRRRRHAFDTGQAVKP